MMAYQKVNQSQTCAMAKYSHLESKIISMKDLFAIDADGKQKFPHAMGGFIIDYSKTLSIKKHLICY